MIGIIRGLVMEKSIGSFLGIGFLGAALVCGCEHAEPRPVAVKPLLPTTVTYSKPPNTVVTPVATASPTPSTSSDAKPAEAETDVKAGSILVSTNPTPVVKQVAVDGESAVKPIEEPAPARKSFVDITARSCFGHAEDYSWISGELQYSNLSKAWRLRYASVDEVDQWGGSATLVFDRPRDDLKEGTCARIRGRLTPAENKFTAPPYQVDSLQIIDKPDLEKAN
jgi:hypothetical protein